MLWIPVIVGFFISIIVTAFASSLHDDLQARLAHRWQEKPSEESSGNRKLLIFLFPITFYILIGTFLLLLLSGIEALTKALRHYASEDEAEVIVWHEVGVSLTLFFPLCFPPAALLVILVFVGALFWAVLTGIQRFFSSALRLAQKLWNNIFDLVHRLVNGFIARIRGIWDVIISGTQTIWRLIVDEIRQVLASINGLVRDIWTTINANLHF